MSHYYTLIYINLVAIFVISYYVNIYCHVCQETSNFMQRCISVTCCILNLAVIIVAVNNFKSC